MAEGRRLETGWSRARDTGVRILSIPPIPSPSSSGRGCRPFKAKTGVRVPVETPYHGVFVQWQGCRPVEPMTRVRVPYAPPFRLHRLVAKDDALSRRRPGFESPWRRHPSIAQMVERRPEKPGVAGSIPARRAISPGPFHSVPRWRNTGRRTWFRTRRARPLGVRVSPTAPVLRR